jgi:hypothetical protein
MTDESKNTLAAILIMIAFVITMGILMVWEVTGYWPWEV